jgi:hypothetical protein
MWKRLCCAILSFKRSFYQDMLGTSIVKTPKNHGRFLFQVKAAVEAWWQDGDGSGPAGKHTHVEGCLRDWDGTPCNPTCGINS